MTQFLVNQVHTREVSPVQNVLAVSEKEVSIFGYSIVTRVCDPRCRIKI